MAPFKKPESNDPDNATFNNHVSILRIRSEHAIGFLKGRFQSLKGLRVNINNKNSHKFATYWVVACIGIHAFAMKCEADDAREAGSDYDSQDDFIQDGLSSSDESEPDLRQPNQTQGTSQRQRRSHTLAAAKARRLQLKQGLFRAQGRRAERRGDSHDSDSSNQDLSDSEE